MNDSKNEGVPIPFLAGTEEDASHRFELLILNEVSICVGLLISIESFIICFEREFQVFIGTFLGMGL